MLNEQTVEQLSSMRLSGMLEAFKEQMTSTRYGKLSFEERFSMMVEKEWELREERALKRRLKKSRIKQQACVQDIDYRHPRGLDRSLMRSLASCRFVKDGHNVIITGPTGVGKSYIACALAHQACLKGFSSFYIRAPRLTEELLLSHADGSHLKFLDRLARFELMVIDDWGIAPLKDQERRDLLEVIEDRAQDRSTIVTSQYPASSWHHFIGDPTIAEAIMDRLIHNAHRLELKGGSMRKVRANVKLTGKEEVSGVGSS